jgi:hypothetical protein
MTPNDVIADVRELIQDTTASSYRYTDAELLGFINQTIKRVLILRPDLFSVIVDISTVANTVAQTLPSDSYRLVELYSVKNGSVLTEVNRESLDQSYPAWVTDQAGTPYNYMRHVRHPNKYFLYPRPIANIVLVGEYIQVPSNYAAGATISVLPDAYLPVLVDGTVFLAESIDDEHVNSGRAKLFLESFTQALGSGLSSRVLTDTEQAGIPPMNPRLQQQVI